MSKREWYRSALNGDRGYRATDEDGQDVIQLDRPNEIITRPYKPSEWKRDDDHRPLNRSHLGMVAFAADAKLCQVMGKRDDHEGDWGNLSNKQRIAWMEDGPKSEGVRRRMYEALMGAIAELGE